MSSPRLVWDEMLTATGGRHWGGVPPYAVSGVSTDTRSLRPGQLFVALKGPRFDGHHFVQQAIDAGAAAVMLSRRVTTAGTQPAGLLVDDTLKALGDLANHLRRSISGLRVVALTGSAGKTTTKEILAYLCASHRVFRTPGNFNNLIGLPLSLLNMPNTPQIAVLELGMSEPGEIARLSQICEPDIGLITNVAAAHLDILKNIEGVAKAKGELFDWLDDTRIAVVNSDDPHVVDRARMTRATTLQFGTGEDCRVRLLELVPQPLENRLLLRVAIDGAEYPLTLSTPGRHNARNALAALACGLALGLDPAQMVKRLELFPFMIDKRLNVRREGELIWIDDTYNANPLSMRAALQTLVDLGQRTVAVLGDMLELGPTAISAHRELGELIAELKLERFIACGPLMEQAVDAALKAGLPAERIEHFDSSTEAAVTVAREAQPKTTILVKGSRGMRMERVYPNDGE